MNEDEYKEIIQLQKDAIELIKYRNSVLKEIMKEMSSKMEDIQREKANLVYRLQYWSDREEKEREK